MYQYYNGTTCGTHQDDSEVEGARIYIQEMSGKVDYKLSFCLGNRVLLRTFLRQRRIRTQKSFNQEMG